MQLSHLLGRLTAAERAELLTRRPLRGNVPFDNSELANILARPDNLKPVFYELNRFQLLLLSWLESQPAQEATWANFMREIGGRIEAGEVERQVKDLRLWGLVDFDNHSGNGFVASYPAVLQNLPRPQRPTLAFHLRRLSGDQLRVMVMKLGLKPASNLKEDRLRAVNALLSSPSFIRALVSRLSPAARELFDWCQEKGGLVSLLDLMRLPGMEDLYTHFSHSVSAKRVPAVDELISSCLLVPKLYSAYARGYADEYAIPIDVDAALAERPFFDDPVRLPPLRSAEEARPVWVPSPSQILRDLGHLRGFIISGRCEWRQDGMPYQRSLLRFAKSLGYDGDGYPAFLFKLGTRTGVIESRSNGDQLSAAAALGSGQLEPGVLFGALVQAWSEGDMEWFGPTPLARPRLRLLDFLAHCPLDSWFTLDSLLNCLRFMWPVVFSPEYSSLPTEKLVDEAFTLMLGSATMADGKFAVMVPSQIQPFLTIDAEEEERGPEALPWEKHCTALPDRTLIAPPNSHPALLASLWCVADLESSQGASVFRVGPASVSHALNHGLTPDDIGELLERCSSGPLPDTVLRLLQDQGARYGQLKIGAAKAYLRAEDPALVDEVLGHAKLRSVKWERVAPGVACALNLDEAQLLRTLREAGYLPVTAQSKVVMLRSRTTGVR